MKFYICPHCGNVVEMVHDSGVAPVCCGEKMTHLEAGAVEASREKHIPVVTRDESSVKVLVGSVLHPMADEHSILWVALKTDSGSQIKHLTVGASPEVVFSLAEEKPLAVYAYCNLHGLWRADV